MKTTTFYFILLFLVSNYNSKIPNSSNCQPRNFAEIKALFQHNPQRAAPFIMAHRGGPAPGFPENCLATFARTLASVSCPLIEFDVRMSKDSVLVLSHDDALEHGSNGHGLLSQSTWSTLKKLKLKDETGQITLHRMPTFSSALKFLAKKPAILIIDNKPGTPLDKVLAAITRAKVAQQSVLICYSLKDAEYVYQYKPDLMLALGFNQEVQIAAIEQSSIPKDQLVALTPREIQSPAYYQRIHQLGISCSLGTNGNIDTLPSTQSKMMYLERFRAGADIICTDHPEQVAKMFVQSAIKH